MEEMLYTVSEVAKLIHSNKAYVYALINAGLLPAIKLGTYKIVKETLLNFLKQNEGMDLTDPYNVMRINLKTNKKN